MPVLSGTALPPPAQQRNHHHDSQKQRNTAKQQPEIESIARLLYRLGGKQDRYWTGQHYVNSKHHAPADFGYASSITTRLRVIITGAFEIIIVTVVLRQPRLALSQ